MANPVTPEDNETLEEYRALFGVEATRAKLLQFGGTALYILGHKKREQCVRSMENELDLHYGKVRR